MIVNVHLFVVLIQTYWHVPHLGVEIVVTIRTFHRSPYTKITYIICESNVYGLTNTMRHMGYNRKVYRSITLFIMLFVYLMTVITAKNYIFDNVLNSPFQKVLAHVSNEYGNITVQTG